MMDKEKLKGKLAKLLSRAEFHSLATYARESLINAVADIAEECEVAEKPNTLKTASKKAVETQAQE